MLPGLEVLDGCDPEGNEVNSENDQEAEEYDIGDRADGGDVISSQDEEDDEEDELEFMSSEINILLRNALLFDVDDEEAGCGSSSQL